MADQEYPLHKAQTAKDVENALAAGENINKQRGYMEETPLHRAVNAAAFEVIEALIKNGANTKAVDRCDHTPLMVACKNDDIETTRFLLGFESVEVDFVSNSGTALTLASEYGHLDIMRLLLQHGANVNTRGAYGCSAIGEASAAGMKEAVDLLLEHGADINIVSHYNLNPLMQAASFGELEIFNTLVEHIADINIKTKEHSALLLAVKCNRVEILQRLISLGVDLESADSSSKTALMWASEKNLVDLVKILLAAGANANARDQDGKTAFDLTTSDEIKQLLSPHLAI